MKVVIRADASLRIGTGHLARCRTLGLALREQGADVQFICRDVEGHRADDLRRDGLAVTLLPGTGASPPKSGVPHADWLEGATPGQDAEQTAAAWTGRPDWLVVDHYALDARWEAQLRPFVDRIAVVDDLADRDHDADLLVDQNLLPAGAGRYAGRLPPTALRLVGPRYALLPPAFGSARDDAEVRTRVTRVLLGFGGVDRRGDTLVALDALDGLELDVDVLVGPANPHRAAILAAAADRPRVRVHVASTEVAQRMLEADLSLGAGGTMTWERACLGLPAVVVTQADNQAAVNHAMAEAGCVRLIEAPDAGTLRDAVERLVADPGALAEMSGRNLALVDGSGCDRVLRALQPGAMPTLRPAGPDDIDDTWHWRNDPRVRERALDPDPIPQATHATWFSSVLADPRRTLLIAEDAEGPVGVLRYDLDGTRAVVSVYLVPDRIGRGLGAPLLCAGSAWLRSAHPGVREVHARIRRDNVASHAAFAGAGYVPTADGATLRLDAGLAGGS